MLTYNTETSPFSLVIVMVCVYSSEVKQASSVVGWFSCALPTREFCVWPSPSLHTLSVDQPQFYSKNFAISLDAIGFPGDSVKNLLAMWDTPVQSLGGEDPLEKGMATHSSILAWKIPWIEEPGGLQSMGF